MAETILYNTVTEILKKLGSMVHEEIGLVSGVNDELHKLKNTVSTIRAVLVDAEEQQATNCEVADWLEKLNDAFCDADDLLDDFSTQVLRRQVMTQNKRLKKVRIFFSSSNQLAFSSKMAHEIKAIKERLDSIAKDKEKFHLTERPVVMRVENTEREDTHSFVRAESVIGRDDDKNNIVEMLLDSNIQENVSVVAIVGIGGVGKTTLAQLVYNDEEVIKYFELKMWVCASNPFDAKLIAQKLIGSEAGRVLQMEELQNQLRTKIDGKKYLIVLDDVWNENRHNWLKLTDLLMGGSRGSKILVTTRTKLVANVTGANYPYFLESLSKEESWSLFKQMTFKQGEESENQCRVKMGKEIVEKCKGVPLAIRAVGSLLYSKDSDAEWLLFKDSDLLNIAQEEDTIFPILKLSYNYLPSHLKRCFAFCSLYLKDEVICKKELIQFWIAHGFIQLLHENQQLEDVGDLYFMDLLRRSLFQDIKRDEWDNIISCKMHDLVHDLAESIVRPKSSIVNSNAKNITERTRHLYIAERTRHLSSDVDSLWEIETHLGRVNKLRTFILKNQYLKNTVFDYKCLRVLNVSSLGMMSVPGYISKLKHLRYLDLSGNAIKTLPNSITKLQNLQTLKLNECKLAELPRDIKKMINLRHLELDRCFHLTRMPYGLGQLTCLLTLTWFVEDSNSSRLSELKSLNNLRGSLRIRMVGHRDSLGRMEGTNCSYLEAKEYLETLELCFDWEEENRVLLESLRPHPNLKELIIEHYGGVSFPNWMMVDKLGLLSSLPNLVTIDITGCNRCKHLPLFGQLPFLQFLSLSNMYSLEYIDNSISGSGGEESLSSSLPSSSSRGAAAIRREPTPKSTFFPSLKQLQLSELFKLKGWWRSEAMATTTLVDQQQHQQQHLKKSLPYCLPSFPSLSILTISGCPNLASMPILQPCLEQLHLEKVSKKLVGQQLMMTVSPTPTISTSWPSSSSLLLHLSKLKSLKLVSIEDHFVTLPECIGNLASLEELSIEDCPKLTSLPEGMRRLTALQDLTITSCANVLNDRCEQETGEDWPKIAHIPDVDVY